MPRSPASADAPSGHWRTIVVVAVLSLTSIVLAACSSGASGSVPAVEPAVTVAGAPVPNSPTPAPTGWHGLLRLPCPTRAADTTVLEVSKASAFDQAWTTYANAGRGWTGGDSVHAYVTGPRQVLWSFADSFLGPIGPGNTRPPTEPLIHSLFVVQDGSRFRTVTGGAPGRPVALVRGRSPRTIFLALAGLQTGNRLQELLLEDRTSPSGAVTQIPSGTLLATYALPSLRQLSVVPLVRESAVILWGADVTRWGADTYVYGATAAGSDKSLYVARVTGTDLSGPWRYWDGHGWSSHQRSAAVVATGVSPEVSITVVGGMAILATTPTTTPYSSFIAFSTACSPVGPFHQVSVVRDSYSTGSVGKAFFGVGDVYVYDAIDQPALNRGSTWLVTFDRNVLRYSDLATSAAIYRPSYLWVRLGPRSSASG